MSLPAEPLNPGDWPVLVTGASGFVGGHVARDLAGSGFPVRALTRKPPRIDPGDPAIEWVLGDLREPAARRRALAGVRAVVHSASWVSLGADPDGEGRSINVGATRDLMLDGLASGVERLVYTSTIHTLASGSEDIPADEATPWNLHPVDSPYARTKREAEAMVLDGLGGRLPGVALCPGMVIGPRDPKPTSTSLLLLMARSPIAFLPGGGIPVIDARVVGQAHRQALVLGEPGTRYALVGPYLTYRELAVEVARVAGRPWRVFEVPPALERPMIWGASWIDRMAGGRKIEISAAVVAGGFLKLHVRGDRADRAFGLKHPSPVVSIHDALEDARVSGHFPGLKLVRPSGKARAGHEPDQRLLR